MKKAMFLILVLGLAGCATAKKENHCPVAVIEVTPVTGNKVGHK